MHRDCLMMEATPNAVSLPIIFFLELWSRFWSVAALCCQSELGQFIYTSPIQQRVQSFFETDHGPEKILFSVFVYCSIRVDNVSMFASHSGWPLSSCETPREVQTAHSRAKGISCYYDDGISCSSQDVWDTRPHPGCCSYISILLYEYLWPGNCRIVTSLKKTCFRLNCGVKVYPQLGNLSCTR